MGVLLFLSFAVAWRTSCIATGNEAEPKVFLESTDNIVREALGLRRGDVVVLSRKAGGSERRIVIRSMSRSHLMTLSEAS